VFGDPARATAEKGELIFNALVEACKPLLADFTRSLPRR
jgi:creatinine amidohydrolase/Fe(II)-dependent formamide hydrolase-like protein